MSPVKELIAQNVPGIVFAPQARHVCNEDLSHFDGEFPLPKWTFAKKQPDGSTLPQVIAHRGDRQNYPENSMLAFRKAVEVGSHALETDIHITRDGVVVLSHDGNLRRCFGKDANIIDLDWVDIAPLRSTRAPHEPIPRLADLLAWLAEPGLEDIWVLLDIKIDVDPTIVLALIAAAIEEVPAHPRKAWTQRVLLGVWGTKYLPLARRHLPGYAVTHITFSTLYARRFLPHEFVCFNHLAATLALWPIGDWFLAAARRRSRSVTAWTVNDDRMMRWAIAKRLDGVITDDPARFVEVKDEWVAGRRDASIGWRLTLRSAWYNLLSLFFLVLVFSWMLRDRYGRKPKGYVYKQLSGARSDKAARLT